MKSVVLGTAGHIDHGKSSLVKALTGIDPDRLKEEKLRGITIELGFAHLDLPSGLRIGIVDVPGHERFVRHMVAGATGIDLVALVVAADEGVMPQTREHLDICRLLEVKSGLVVLTKTDLVEPDWLELVKEDVTAFVAGSFLEGAPIVPVSAVTGTGLSALVAEIDRLAAQVAPRPAEGLLRLPIDRVFSLRGFGTVVTGTLVAGTIAVGDTVQILPSGRTAKVRGLHVHGQPVERSAAGRRTAVNLQGVEVAEVARGEVLVPPGAIEPARLIDAHLHLLPAAPRPLKHRAVVRLHIGTAEVPAAVHLLDREALEPGESAFVQLRLKAPIVTLGGDRFVIRAFSPPATLGGGQVLDPQPPRARRFVPATLEALRTLKEGSDEEVIALHLARGGVRGRSVAELHQAVLIGDRRLAQILQDLMTRRVAIQYDKEAGRLVHRDAYDQVLARIREALAAYHREFPLREGMGREELKGRLPAGTPDKLFARALADLSRPGPGGQPAEVVAERDLVRLASHTVSLGGGVEALRDRIETIYRKAGNEPPIWQELLDQLGAPDRTVREVMDYLVRQRGTVVKVKEGLYYHRDALDAIRARVVEFIRSRGQASTQEIKDLLGLSRKFLIPLLEYFDAAKVTMRIGEVRVLRGPAAAASAAGPGAG
ncbi:MAG TPA: selenocysteine-specific translation elongation factor, partial [Thermodesulfobacteriota bacterium]|nr:selenocysteine-specific translation elongation factor [Thermodesulfobacteriota bacterium]